MIELKKLGKICQRYRQEQGVAQTKVAFDTNYSKENVSAFECGKNDNVQLFLWYVYHGLKKEHIFNGGNDDGI